MTTLKRFNWLLLALLSVIERSSSSTKVVGRAGEDITLLCKYNISYNGATSVCWGRGSIPTFGCNNRIISTEGHKVIESTRVSSRYQLLGQLEDGDVSLTILKTTEEDAGLYGCRVQIPGWFNDEKHNIDLTIEKDPAPQSTTSTTTNRETSTEQTTDTYATSHVTPTESVSTSPPDSAEAKPQQMSSSTTVVLVSVLFALIALVTAGVIIIIARRSNQLKIPQQQQVFSSVQFRSTSTTLQLQSRGSAVENIYQIDGDGDGGGDYELCP